VGQEQIIDGRFGILRPLGAGGAGELLLVRDRQVEGEPCALKILRPKERDPGLIPLFRHEFLLLSAIDHPSVVKVRGFGVLENGEPWFSMDFVPGENARAFVAQDRLEAMDYVEFASSILGALARVHAQGIIHRDVKPENIIMRREDDRLAPVLVDFGLAIGSAVGSDDVVSGTPPYIAPELIAGAAADARADLFSLGMVLYELCVGAYPAKRSELLRNPGVVFAPERLRRGLNRSARDSVPRKFEDFVVRLLAANPNARYPSAAAALEALGSIYEADIEVVPDDLRLPPPNVELPLVGRRSAQEALLRRIDALRDGQLLEPIAVVAGSGGAGVTRLLSVARYQASADRCDVFSGSTLLDLFREVAVVSAEVDPSADRRPDEGAGLTPAELLFRIDASLEETKRRDPPVLLLDNVDRMDESEVAALRDWIVSLEQRRGRARLLLVLGGSTDCETAGADLLRSAGRAVPVELRDLAPLAETDIRTALSILLGGARVSPNVTETLHRASNGSPRVLAELVRLLLREGILDFRGDEPVLHAERLREAKLPDSVIEVARARARDLSEAARAALPRLALFPGPLPEGAARAAAGDALGELLRTAMVVREAGRIRFPYEVARRAHDVLTGDERHQALTEIGDAVRDAHPEVGAHLIAMSGRRVEARAFGLRAAEDLIRAGRAADAKRLLLVMGGEDPDEATALLFLRALSSTGSVHEAADFGHRMLGQFESTALALATATALMRADRNEDALELVERYGAEAEGLIAARLQNARAALLTRLGRLDEALEASHHAEEIAGSSRALGMRIAAMRGRIFRKMRRYTAAYSLYSELLEGDAGEKGLDAESLKTVRINRAAARIPQARAMSALADLRLAARPQSGRRPGMPEANAWRGIAEVFARLGRFGRALPYFERARRVMQAAARAPDVAWCLGWEALCLLHLGRPAEGEARLARARAMPVAGEDDSTASLLARVHGLFLFHSGRPEEAIHALGAVPDGSVERCDWVLTRARIAELEGDPRRCEAAWREALETSAASRHRVALADVRVHLAAAAGLRGAWRMADRLLALGRGEWFSFKTSVRARSLLVRATGALHRKDVASAGRLLEESVAVANRTDDAPLRAEVYAVVASLLEEPAMQRYLREPTAEASAVLLEAAREIWTLYGNETMLHKIDLHLSELPRPAGERAGPEADRLVKVLHVARELNREFDRDKLLSLILDRAIELTGAERGFVILLDGGREQVRIARNIDREAISEPEQKLSSQVVREVIETGRIVRSEDAELDSHFADSLSVRQLRLKSIIAVPFRSAGRTVGALYLDNRFRTGNFSDKEERLLELFADQAVSAIARAELVRELEAKSAELKSLHRKQQRDLREAGRELENSRNENRQHRRDRGYSFDLVISRSVAMQALVREAKRLAASDLAVLVAGESGTGKEMVSRAMHYASPRQSMPFVAVNCAAFPEGLLESELFGHVRGSFSGADRDRPGLFEEANGGTLFLDEAGEMSLPMQVKLLRALELGEVRRLGEARVRTVDVRIIAASNADMEELVRMGRFREDLKYRLIGSMITVPPLRERLEDLEPLVEVFLEEAARQRGEESAGATDEALARLEAHPWPGNVRELRNVVLRALVSAEGEPVDADDIVFDVRSSSLLPGFDPAHAERIVEELSARGIELNRRQQSAIARALTKGKLSFSEYAKIFRVSKSTTSRDLETLQERDLLEKRGKTRATVYLPGTKLREIAKRIGLS
jgi:transcriptional regulator with GAF, ATPase, and Fis domain